MAIAGNDGSIILTTRVDTSGINKGMTSIKSIVGKVGGVMAAAFSVRALINFGKEAINLASDLQEVQNVVDTAFGDMSYKIERFSKKAIENFGISELTAKRTASTYMAMAKGMGIAEDVASDMAITMTGLTADIASFYNMSQERADVILKSVYTGETETLKQLGIVMTEVNLQNFAMSQGITKNISKMTQQEKTMLRYQFVLQQTALAQGDFAKTSNSWANQTRILAERWKEMQRVFGQAFVAIGTLILPAVNTLIAGMTKLANIASVAAQSIYKMFTGKTLEIGQTESVVSNLGGASTDAAGGMSELGDATEKAGKQAKKALAGFDDLEIITSNVSDSAGSAAGAVGGLGGLAGGMTETGEGADYQAEADKISGALASIMGAIGISLAAVGLLLLLSGNIGWGIGFIVAGATIFGVSMASLTSLDIEELKTRLQSMQTAASLALVGIGIILLMLGQIPWGLGFIVGGAALYGISKLAQGDTDIDKTALSRVQAIEKVISGVFVSLGLILMFLGQVAWGLGFIVAGAVIYGVSQTAIGETDADVNTIERIGAITAIVGASLIAIGLLLLFLGQVPWGLGFIVTGAGLVSVSEIFPTTSAEEILGHCDAILSFLAGLVGYLIAQQLLTHWTTFVKLWGDFRALMALIHSEGFFKTIIGLFGSSLSTMQLWAIAIGVIVGSITYFAMNWDKLSPAQRVITMLTSLAAAATAAAVAIALFHTSWSVGVAAAAIAGGVALLAGTYLFKSYNGKKNVSGGGEAPQSIGQYAYLADSSTYKLPALAKGAVLPPNKPFLALVGDQKHGTNIEAPLQTIVDAFNIALQGNANYGGGNTEVVLEIDGREFGRAVVEQGNRENRRIGTRLVIA